MARDTDVTKGQIVHFAWVDPILGGEIERVGLVLDVAGDELTVAPLAGYALTVPASTAQLVQQPDDVPAAPPATPGGASS